MHTLNDYLNATAAEQDAEHKRRGWEPRPPAARTHRGSARTWTLEGHHQATKTPRTPTHRLPGKPTVPAWAQFLLAASGKEPNRA